MTRGAYAAAALLCMCALWARPARAGDPYLRWYTVKTPHFRVHYTWGLEEVAQRTASLAEAINGRLQPDLGWQPSEVTHIRLSDGTDSANGSAAALPFNTIRLFVTAPDDMSPLGDYDDWILELLTHEHTHILHVDNVTGAPALVNAILGKTLVPNQVQPRWILEGLAVLMESRHTSGGRIRSTLFDMYLRADVLEDNLATLDEMSHNVRRWPGTNIWYLYGGRFMSFIAKVYGVDTFAAVSADYGNNPIPWGINRVIRRATGRTYPQLYEGWKRHLERRYRAQARAVRRRGLREGDRLTYRGQVAAHPRFVPRCARKSRREELLYYRDDGHTVPGFYRLPLATRSRALWTRAERVVRTAGSRPNASFDPDCGLVFSSRAPSDRRHRFMDLYRQGPGSKSPFGLKTRRERWTTGLRARDPDVGPDGRRLVFVTNHAGTTTLRIADILSTGGIGNIRALVPSARFEQAFSPRFSPDGRRVAYSVWTKGGYRDVRIVDVDTGRFTRVTHDRALEHQPSWSPDARTVFFVSDRTGIANVYAYEIDSNALWQVTNVINGAYMPEVAPDGKTLFYVGYTHDGFDLFSMPLSRERWLEPLEPPPDHPERPTPPTPKRWPVEPYAAWATLRPRSLDLEYGDATFGKGLTVRVEGDDIARLHSLSAALTYQTQIDEPTGSLNYTFRRLPFHLNLSAFRNVVPRRGFRINDETRTVREEQIGVTSGLTYPIPGEFDSHRVSFSYTLASREQNLPIDDDLEPFALVTREPFDGFLASVRAAWRYENTFRSSYGISEERGYTISLSGDFAGPETGSEATLAAVNARFIAYVPVVVPAHHVLAIGASAGASAGTFPNRGFFFTGGFTEQRDLIGDFQSGIRQSAFVLRGYEPGQFVGRQFNLYNVEYRFPIWYADTGISTLPAFLRTLAGVLFADYGGAFDRVDPDDPLTDYHLGIGAELRTSLTFGYFADGTVRIGVARGLDDEAVEPVQTYIVLAASF